MNRILILEDKKKLAAYYQELLEQENYTVKAVHNSKDFLVAYKSFPAELLILDIKLNKSELSGLEVFQELIDNKSLNSKVIILSGEATRTEIAKAMQLGAYTFIEKSGEFNIEKFLADVRQAINLKLQEDKNRSLADENVSLRDKLSAQHPFIGDSAAIQRVKHLIEKFAAAEADILLLGETGTGKEIAANYFYRYSPRFVRPIVTVNAGSIPESLIDSELFGHKKGAFTGAVSDRKGYFEQAHNGILFLDEMFKMDMNAQARILRAIEYKEIRILGGPVRKIDVNIIFGANEEPEEMIEEGKVRQDLYYRLEGNTIRIPPLRERDNDVLILAEFFVQKFTEKHKCIVSTNIHSLGKMLKSYKWPGNVRELKKFIEYVFILHDVVDNEVIEQEFRNKLNGNLKHDSLTNLLNLPDYSQAVDVFKVKFLKHQIAKHNGSIFDTAKTIGLDKTNIYKILKKKMQF